NPYNHLSFLTSQHATQLQVSRYIVNAVLGAWCWDFLTSLWEEYTIFRKRVTLPDLGYIFARYASTPYIFAKILPFQIALTWSQCNTIRMVIGVFGLLAFSLNSLLFLFRIFAVFCGRRLIIGIFTFLWIGVFACSLTSPFAMPAQHLGPTGYCVSAQVKKFGISGIVAAAVYDTLVFLAITWELSLNAPVESPRDRMKAVVSGAGMGRISKSLLQGGQLYYLMTVGLNICAVVLVLTPSVPIAYSNVMITPNIALQNAMASRVFRKLKL
ncbi:hypothetical protein BXZ70DRAFT_861922, partial [Cristinia sonorae]